MEVKNLRLASIENSKDDDVLVEAMNGYKKYQVIRSALDLGIFEYLAGKGSSDREEICQALHINGMFIRSLLQTLVEMGLLQQAGDDYQNAGISQTVLVSGSNHYLGDWFIHACGENSNWNNLTATVTRETAKPGAFNDGPGKDFIKSLAQRSLRGELQAVVNAVKEWQDFDSAVTLADVGGGHGLYAIAFCQENLGLKATVYDKPFVTEYTRDYIKAYGMEGRVDVQSGDITLDPLEGQYDIVFLSHLLYKFRKDLPGIFEKVNASLKPGGLFVSNHWFCAPGCAAGHNGITELDVAIHSFGHPLCHIETFDETLGAQGFSVVMTRDIPGEFGDSKLHLCEKVEAPVMMDRQGEQSSCCC